MQSATRCLVVIVLCLTGLVCASTNASANDTPVPASAEGMPRYVLVDAYGPDGNSLFLADSVYYEWAGSLRFRVNHTDPIPGSPLMAELLDSVMPLARERRYRLTALDLRGAASPEGPWLNNVRLAHGRAQALIERLQPWLDQAAPPVLLTSEAPEDYPGLLWLLERAGDSAAPVVAALIARYGAGDCAAIKEALQRINGGALWRRLLRDYFPALRAARVVLYFESEREQPQLARPVIPAPTLAPVDPLTDVSIATRPMTAPRRHVLALGSNLLYDAFYMPNFGWAPMLNASLEYFPERGNFTFLAAFTGPYYHRHARHKFFQIRDYHLEARRYFRPGDRHTGPYLGAYVNATKYGIGLGPTKGWEGEGVGGALKAGYVFGLGRGGRWRLDLHVAAGAWHTRYDPYVWGNPVTGEADGDYYYDYTGPVDSFRRRNHGMWWFGPTEVGVTLTFDILYRRADGGLSWRGKEVIRP